MVRLVVMRLLLLSVGVATEVHSRAHHGGLLLLLGEGGLLSLLGLEKALSVAFGHVGLAHQGAHHHGLSLGDLNRRGRWTEVVDVSGLLLLLLRGVLFGLTRHESVYKKSSQVIQYYSYNR